MNLTLAYLGKSRFTQSRQTSLLSLAPNLTRDQVAFDAPLRYPLRFREAISALHDVVISDLRYKPRDKTAYQEWKQAEQQRLEEIRRQEYKRLSEQVFARQEIPLDFEREYKRCLKEYWRARQQYSNYLMQHYEWLWRLLMPCDPVITVSDDVVFFECFSADESSYGCLTVDRDHGFGKCESTSFGTTNVDYSWDLYEHFQKLRSYRETRFRIDPHGFEVASEGQEDYREEKIDLPGGWLRGFMQVQSAMTMPAKRIPVSREAVYSILVWLKRHKAKQSPRAIRFEYQSGKSPAIVLEPWEKRIESVGTRYEGPDGAPIRIWGRNRLLVLARILPLAERFDVYLVGTGMPSFWVARMGEMRLTLGLSGWTTNDWTRGSFVDLLGPLEEPSEQAISSVAGFLRAQRKAPLQSVQTGSITSTRLAGAALLHLARSGQAIFDLDAGVYRWRQILPRAVGEEDLGPDNPELKESRELIRKQSVTVRSREPAPHRAAMYSGKAGGCPVELIIDADGRIKRGKCVCSYYRQYGLRRGPCRHLLAMRAFTWKQDEPETLDDSNWLDRIVKGSKN